MSLYKQIAILISIIFVVLFGIVLWVSFDVVKNNAQKALYENAQNSASSISLSIQNGGLSPSSIRTVINAAYDNGNYEKIIFKDTNGNINYSAKKQKNAVLVPGWFDSFVSFKNSPSIATISSGWKILGTVEVYSDTGLFRLQLYEIFWKLLAYLTIVYMVLLGLLYLFLQLILNPLKDVTIQAQAIMNSDFKINENQPKTHEFNILVETMNNMTKKVEQIFDNANSALHQNRELLYIDQVTKLKNRLFFELKASEYINSSGVFSGGSLIVIGIKNVDLLNKVIGYNNVDVYFKKLAQSLKSAFIAYPENLFIRLNGSEFVAMLPGAQVSDVLPVAQTFYANLLREFNLLNINGEDIDLYLGLCQYYNEKTISELFSKIDYALTSAKLNHNHEVYLVNHDIPKNPKTQWRNIFKDAFEKREIIITCKPILNVESKETFLESVHISLCAFNETYEYKTFIAPLIELQFMNEFYTFIFKALLQKSRQVTPLTLPLPLQYIQNENSFDILRDFLVKNSKTHQNEIIFEIQESILETNLEKILQLVALVNQYKCGIAIDNFIANTKDYNHFKYIKPVYIKSPKEFISSHEQSINLINILLNSLGSKLIATNIKTEDEIKELKKHKIYLYM